MMPIEEPRGLERYVGRPLYSADNVELGKIDRYLLHRVTGLAAWIQVQSGVMSARTMILPVAGCDFAEDHVTSPYSQQKIENQPDVEVEDGVLSAEGETQLDEYYDLGAESSEAGVAG